MAATTTTHSTGYRVRRGIRSTLKYLLMMLLAFLFLFPIWFMLVSSFKQSEMQVTSDISSLKAFIPYGDIGLQNYYDVFTQLEFGRMLFNSTFIMITTVLLLNSLGPEGNPMFHVPWFWHFVIGGWAFGTVFLATDPVAAATTNPGRWGFGILVGALTIIVRVTNPSYYEGVVFAILLACIFSPMFDYLVVERNIKRRKQRVEAST